MSGRLAFAVIEDAVRDGVVVHAMQALLLPVEVVDADDDGRVLCSLKTEGVITCADLRSRESSKVSVEPGARRLWLLDHETRCVLGGGATFGAIAAPSSTKAWGRSSAPRGLRPSRCQAPCFITRDRKLVCVSEDGFASVTLESVTHASVGRGKGDFGGGCAVTTDETVKCWGGMNDTGVLGDGERGPHTKAATAMGVTRAVSVARSPDFACALTRDRQVWCWGSADAWSFGETALAKAKAWPVCGERDAPGRDGCVTRAAFGPQRNHLVLRPMRVPELDGVVSIATSAAGTCGVRTDGRLLCVGSGHAGAYTVDLAKP